MRVICKNLPHGVIYAGEYYPVRTGHNVWLEFARLIESELGAQAALRALRLCYRDKIPPDFGEALSLLCEFFSGGATEHKAKNKSDAIFSFSEDEALIYASFYSEYGIDLAEKELHWWRFLALLRGLSQQCALMRVAAIRMMKPSEIKDSKRRRRMIELKRTFALRDSQEANVGDVLGAAFGGSEVESDG